MYVQAEPYFLRNWQANLAVSEAKLAVANDELETAQAQLDEKQKELDTVQAMYDAAMAEKQVLQYSYSVFYLVLYFNIENLKCWTEHNIGWLTYFFVMIWWDVDDTVLISISHYSTSVFTLVSSPSFS